MGSGLRAKTSASLFSEVASIHRNGSSMVAPNARRKVWLLSVTHNDGFSRGI